MQSFFSMDIPMQIRIGSDQKTSNEVDCILLSQIKNITNCQQPSHQNQFVQSRKTNIQCKLSLHFMICLFFKCVLLCTLATNYYSMDAVWLQKRRKKHNKQNQHLDCVNLNINAPRVHAKRKYHTHVW